MLNHLIRAVSHGAGQSKLKGIEMFNTLIEYVTGRDIDNFVNLQRAETARVIAEKKLECVAARKVFRDKMAKLDETFARIESGIVATKRKLDELERI